MTELNVLGGDATRDGSVNALDLGAAKRSLNAVVGATSRYDVFADVTGDGRNNALDLGAIKQALKARRYLGRP